jgi:hypothetical protein
LAIRCEQEEERKKDISAVNCGVLTTQSYSKSRNKLRSIGPERESVVKKEEMKKGR